MFRQQKIDECLAKLIDVTAIISMVVDDMRCDVESNHYGSTAKERNQLAEVMVALADVKQKLSRARSSVGPQELK